MLLDQLGETGDLRLAEKQQVFGLAIVLELEAGGGQGGFDLAFGLGRVTLDQARHQ
ncbi:hypothetical protein D3C80_2191100 [compost metagenome]